MNPEEKIREVVNACADCDICRSLMDSTCLLFPELYRLYDKEKELGETIRPDELRNLVDLCNFCAVCPCPNIRADIMLAKTAFIERDGMSYNIRIIEDVERIGKLCGAFPQMTNFLLQSRRIGGLLKGVAGIHKKRKFPRFPEEDFPAWVKKQSLDKGLQKKKKKVAYFAGCTARYFFPEVPKAAIEVFQHNGIEVYFPEQKCCGMPTLLEDDQRFTLKLVGFNVDHLGEYLRDLHVAGELENSFGPISIRSAYYPPCHLREQNIGRPYQDLLGLIPGISIESIEDPFYCCGMAGIMGFKREFHKTSIKMGSRLIGKIKDIDPQWLVTDCLSCRLQFNQITPYKVLHPIEILKKSYAA